MMTLREAARRGGRARAAQVAALTHEERAALTSAASRARWAGHAPAPPQHTASSRRVLALLAGRPLTLVYIPGARPSGRNLINGALRLVALGLAALTTDVDYGDGERCVTIERVT